MLVSSPCPGASARFTETMQALEDGGGSAEPSTDDPALSIARGYGCGSDKPKMRTGLQLGDGPTVALASFGP